VRILLFTLHHYRFQIWPGHEIFHFLLHSFASIHCVCFDDACVWDDDRLCEDIIVYLFHSISTYWHIHHPFQDVQCQRLPPLSCSVGVVWYVWDAVEMKRNSSSNVSRNGGRTRQFLPPAKSARNSFGTVHVDPSKTTSCVISVPSKHGICLCGMHFFPCIRHDHLQSCTYCTTCNTFRAFLTVWFCRIFVQ